MCSSKACTVDFMDSYQQECLQHLVFGLFSLNMVKLHTYGNWYINLNCKKSQQNINLNNLLCSTIEWIHEGFQEQTFSSDLEYKIPSK